MRKILFVCVHNSGRSQIAQGFFNALADGRAAADSAGTQPADRVNPTVVQVMREVGIDINRRKPKMLALEMMEKADRVIFMGCGVKRSCPAGVVSMEDWGIDDPEGRPVEDFQRIRNEIKRRVLKLVAELDGNFNGILT